MGDDETAIRDRLGEVVPDDLLNGYLALRASGGAPPEEVAAVVGSAELADRLMAFGMAHHGAGTGERILASTPDTALEAWVRELQRRCVVDQQRLISGDERLLSGRPAAAAGIVEDPSIEIIRDSERIHELSHTLILTARHEFVSLESPIVDRTVDEQCACTVPEPVQGTLRARAIYDSTMLASPIISKIIEESVASGEEARVLPRVQTKFKMADGRVVLAPLTPSGMGGAALIRAEPVVAVFRHLFEALWRRASPIGKPSAKAAMFSPIQQEVLRYMSQGLDRQEIADRLGRHVNTVDRNMHIIMDKLGVTTWFVAGMVAVRRGLIE